jgi:hypothetical protein
MANWLKALLVSPVLAYSRPSCGDTNKAFSQFAIEKQLFPEAGPYMDFLMSNKQGVQQAELSVQSWRDRLVYRTGFFNIQIQRVDLLLRPLASSP